MLHKILKSRRQALKWTQARAAKAAGITQTTLSRLESGATEPSLNQLRKLARAYKTKDWQLLKAAQA